MLPLLAAAALAGARWEASASAAGVTLDGRYEEFPVGGLLEQAIEVEIRGVPPGTPLVFELDGMRLGSATADGGGRARLSLAYHQVPPDPDGRPDGPRVNDGSVLAARSGAARLEAVFQPVP